MLALFLTLFHSEKLSLRSRVLSLRFRYAYVRVSTRVRDLYVSADLYVCTMYIYVSLYVNVCVNDARTMALNWRLTGEQ